jgi:hypothetical protein
MITEETIKTAEAMAAELRQQGALEQAQAIEGIIAAVRQSPADGAALPLLDEMPNMVGVTGQIIKDWVHEGRYTGYRAGTLPIRGQTVQEYVRRAGPSLELEDLSDVEAARLVTEERDLE